MDLTDRKQYTTSPIMVSGASGYIASWIVKKLLDAGHTVHATVRDISDSNKTQHLHDMAKNSSLVLFEANLLEERSFVAAMQGCKVLIHTASPVLLSSKNVQRDIIDPALVGTQNILQSVQESNSIQRVVLTSSIAAVYNYPSDMKRLGIKAFREEHWNSTSSIRHNPYSHSKTVAEKFAWDYVQQQKVQQQKREVPWDLVVINPGFVVGPTLNGRIDTSLALLQRLGDGTMRFGAMNRALGMVDVEDVVDAHISAAFLPEASGRNIIVENTYTIIELARILQKHFGSAFPFPRKNIPKWLLYLFAPFVGLSKSMIQHSVNYPLAFDNNYSKRNLHVQYRPIAKALVATFQQIVDMGIVKKKNNV